MWYNETLKFSVVIEIAWTRALDTVMSLFQECSLKDKASFRMIHNTLYHLSINT